MSKDNKTIYEFDIRLICDFFLYMKRQGPGSPEVTLRASGFVDNLTDKSLIADIGCGTGGQTMTLAQHVPGKITGLDLFPGFVDRFNRNAQEAGLRGRVKGVVGTMECLPFEEESLDLIWSEGAIYNIGFERGVNEWRKYLKPEGYLAVSESVWLSEQRPAEIQEFWMENYPEIDTVSRKVGQVQEAGYVPVATFVLPENCWTEHYFAPLAAGRADFLERHAGNVAAEQFVAFQRREEELYRKYKDFYGYAFFIAKRLR